MDFDGHNLQTQTYDDAVEVAEKALGLTVDRARVAYGTQGATVGFPTNQGTWVHLAWRPLHRAGSAWTGVELASAITGVRKPHLFRSYRWWDDVRDVVWRADEVERATSPAVSASGSIAESPVLGETWWGSLRESLSALAGHSTDRVAMSQGHLAGRLSEVFGSSFTYDADVAVVEWSTAHGDLHWGNLTAPEFVILDWESWGKAPRGYDAATLWGFSLGVPEVSARIEQVFDSDFSTRSGKLSQLMFCANVLRQFAKRGKVMPFTDGVRAAAPRLLRELGLTEG